MAKLGFRTINEMVGRSDKLKVDDSLRNHKTAKIDLGPLLKPAFKMRPGAATYHVRNQDHRMHVRLDNKFIDEAELSLTKGFPSRMECNVVNTDRAIGTTLSNRVSRRYGEDGLPKDTIHIDLKGSAGQSMGAFLAPGITLELEGDANDYVGKGLSGGRIVVYPPKNSSFKSNENVIVGNVCLYGATSGDVYFSGIAAERFAVRNSGANAVVEGVGDHGCEYMTGGRVVILGNTGRNFAAGMSGGIAYVLDIRQDFKHKVNPEMVSLDTITDPHEIAEVRSMIESHMHYTGSEIASWVLRDFNQLLSRFVRVMPNDFRKVLEAEAAQVADEKARLQLNSFMDVKDGIPMEEDRRSPAPQSLTLPVSHAELAYNKSEAPVQDLEDSMGDAEALKKAEAKLDKTRGFMKYKRLAEHYRNVGCYYFMLHLGT